jgi:hypothetical protein
MTKIVFITKRVVDPGDMVDNVDPKFYSVAIFAGRPRIGILKCNVPDCASNHNSEADNLTVNMLPPAHLIQKKGNGNAF